MEKLCSDIYRTNHGISKYIEDMEMTSYITRSKIPAWESTYKKLKELRWKRNQYVHEGNVEFDNEDTEWLVAFYQKIISGEDPLSLKRVLDINSVHNRNISEVYNMNGNYSEPLYQKTSSIRWEWLIILVIIIFIISLMVAIIFL